jgi:hypothetical protein
MPQMQFTLPADVAAKLRKKAKARGLSVARYVAEVVRRDVASGWPRGFFDEVVGGWKGTALTRPAQGVFEQRDEF